MNVLLKLKSRVIGQALCELLAKDNGRDLIFTDSNSNANGCGGVDVIIADQGSLSTEFLARWPEAKVILLDTGLPQEDVTTLVLMYKLQGVLSTDEDVTLVKKALRLVHEGQIWINNSNLKALLCKAGTISQNVRMEHVSKREKEILEQIVKGRKNREIASELFMSEQTVKAHISRIFKKFNVSSRTQLVSLLINGSHDSLNLVDHSVAILPH